jgi:Uma2 family endonuclease
MAAPQLWGDEYNLGNIPIDELVALWDNGTINELWEGRLVQESMTYPLHALVANHIGHLLVVHLTQYHITAQVGQHMLFDLTQLGHPRTVLAPDVVILPVNAIIQPRVIPTFAPWLAIEIISPSQTMTQMHLKAHTYLQSGTAEVWILDPEQVMIEILTASSSAVFTHQQALVSALLPRFTLMVQTLIP